MKYGTTLVYFGERERERKRKRKREFWGLRDLDTCQALRVLTIGKVVLQLPRGVISVDDV